MLGLPIYLIGSTYYLHTRIHGKQVKRSLRTSYQRVAIMRATTLLHTLAMTKPLDPANLPAKYELDLARGILKAEGTEDHARLMEAMAAMNAMHAGLPAPQRQEPIAAAAAAVAALPEDKNTLKLGELLDKFFLLRKHLTQATVLSYKTSVGEFSQFLKNPAITNVMVSDVTRYQEFLAQKGNSVRTIDNKTSIIRALYNFGKKQGYTRQENPAADRALMTKKQRLSGGFSTFEPDDIVKLLHCEFFKTQQAKNPDYAAAVMLALFTGCRVGEITGLEAGQIQVSRKDVPYIKIRDAKTPAGIREVPLHPSIRGPFQKFAEGKAGQLFKYAEKDGKGTGNAVGKMFARHIKAAGIEREGLVFHSIRKFVNNELLNHNVSLEQRCQLMGHQINNVNVSIYTKAIPLDDLASKVFPTFDYIAKLAGNTFDPMGDIDMSTLIDEDTSI